MSVQRNATQHRAMQKEKATQHSRGLEHEEEVLAQEKSHKGKSHLRSALRRKFYLGQKEEIDPKGKYSNGLS